MFVSFFYDLRAAGVEVSPTSFLTLQRAAAAGLIESLADFYVAARAILVKREAWFDTFDQVFAATFRGAELPEAGEDDVEFWARALLDEWLRDPVRTARDLGLDEETVRSLSIADLLAYFRDRLREQAGRHDGGSRWIGTGGTAPVGHAGHHPGGMRVGGESHRRSAVQVAARRRYRDYAADRVLDCDSIGEALQKLRHLVPRGAQDRLDVDATIRRTVRNGGEIELVFERAIVDRLRVILAIDNGGWSMEPYVGVVRTLFSYARAQFRDLSTYYFHNTVYDNLWADAGRRRNPVAVDSLKDLDPDTCLIMVGDASMAPYELMVPDGSIYSFVKSGRPSIERLEELSGTFPRHAWLNPVAERDWPRTRTIGMIGRIFPMFPLTLDGLERAVAHLMRG